MTANTLLVTKQFGNGPWSQEGIFPLKTRITAHGNDFIRDSGRVSQRGQPSLAVRPLRQVRHMESFPFLVGMVDGQLLAGLFSSHPAMAVTALSVPVKAFPLHFSASTLLLMIDDFS